VSDQGNKGQGPDPTFVSNKIGQRRQSICNIVGSTLMVRLEGLKSEALRAERVGVIWEVMLPSPSASLVALGSAVGSGENPDNLAI